ncbi:MAG TPA: hypothetical protein VN437_06930, partial [Rectinemataceae bacterium]|nr:hypothetical protein [Rectinemataceae bacterium]
NMVFFTTPEWVDGTKLASRLAEKGILINPPEGGLCRFVTHYWIKKEHIDKVVALMAEFSESGGSV